MTFRIKQGDLEPSAIIPLTDGGVSVDLGDADVKIRGRYVRTGEEFVSGSPLVDPVNGIVTHIWQQGETDIPGRLLLEVVPTWPGGRPETFPVSGYLVVEIEESL